jgi:hypothetical protein
MIANVDFIEIFAAQALLNRKPGDRRTFADFVSAGRSAIDTAKASGASQREAADCFLAAFGITSRTK